MGASSLLYLKVNYFLVYVNMRVMQGALSVNEERLI